MNKPVAVIINDVHYNIHTLPLADAAMHIAVKKANSLNVPLIVAGDLHDTKANLRGECVNAIIKTLSLCDLKPIIIIGNHDKINERSKDHSLNFLKKYVNYIIDEPRLLELGPDEYKIYAVPYFSDVTEIRKLLRRCRKNIPFIMHQGIKGANSGEYIQDKSALDLLDVAAHRIISGHYHVRQTINLPQEGKWDFVGNPYTLNFGEAKDPEKGFQILYDDDNLEFVPTNLRRHNIKNYTVDEVIKMNPLNGRENIYDTDILWVKVTGNKEQLTNINKDKIRNILNVRQEFKLDLISIDTTTTKPKKQFSQNELLDFMIDSLMNVTDDCKLRLKEKWKTL